ncbi:MULTISPECIES: 1-phosphofructokinase family hexose kinase [unclassified Halanaerobium]|uniref:1-phosphofructokinase family hexose kinase n=1 Tax=unclassified Halanaerobium TaxID=2641197 RepID=UPI000DF1302B|nr:MULTISPECIES: PfkB family carbohydrate kinase [unclassified Halanaerobium]RCW48253.1 1-phosphofructokinase [Halanaerobium sp. MA284_MarDTE_T2]RCW85680.1 1-phosphofructokinase [Halanaerobium sp. DL-01]
MITTVTLNPSIDREYFVDSNEITKNQFIYNEEYLRVYPGGKGLLTAINLKKFTYPDVQNIGFVGGKQGSFFEKMVQKYKVITNYIYTDKEIRNNVKIISKNPFSYTQYNDYTYKVDKIDVEDLIKRYKRGIVESEIIVIAGSIPEGVGFDIYKILIDIAHNMDKKVYLQASGEALKLALSAEPEFVTPYFKHHKSILDKEIKSKKDYIKAGLEMQDRGAEYVMIPFHCDRLLFDADGRVYKLTPDDYCIINWLGAGDAYNAAFLDYVYQNGFDFLEANRHGGAAALWIAENKKVVLNNGEDFKCCLKRLHIEELEV